MASVKPDFSRILFTGVKKRKSSSFTAQNSEQELRLRILPENNRENELLPKITKEIEDDENSSAVRLFSFSKKTSAPKSKPKDGKLDRQQKYFAEVRKLNRVFTWGEDIPNPFIDFSELELPEAILKNLTEFRITEPTPIQMQAIPLMLQKRDILASAPTGSGKTLAFIIPILKELTGNPVLNEPFALILEPTRVLAKQVYVQFVKYCQNLDLKYSFYEDGDFPLDSQIIITTPSRLIDVAGKDEKIVKQLSKLHWVIVDESDRLFNNEDGSADFKKSLGKIFKWADGNHTRRAFFSATFSAGVESWCQQHLTNVAMLCIGERNTSNSLVTQQLVFAGSECGKVSAIKDVIQGGFEPPALIFVQNKDRAGQLYTALCPSFPSIPIALITSEVTDKQKDKVLDEVRAKKIFILICTELIGRGIDLPTVNLVINFDLPSSIVNYIHRVGRTGRAGKTGKAITYFTEADLKFIRPVATVIHQAGFEVPPYTLSLDKPNVHSKKELKTLHRRKFAGTSRWERVKKIQQQKDEIISSRKLAKKDILVDDDTGGDMISKKRLQKRFVAKKKLLVKKKDGLKTKPKAKKIIQKKSKKGKPKSAL
ncbi:hypothetical protein FO519_003753 [Halicephalobus sp. NKZ332]|nr:hypothetical protein FO519_003753 [Halicephalobus sp. NKZ332]